MVNKWLNNAQSGLFPAHCILCGAPGAAAADLCVSCRAELPRPITMCRICALPLHGTGDDGLCGHCQQRMPPYARCLAPYTYGPPVDYLIKHLKFDKKLAVARLLGGLMAELLAPAIATPPDVIVPVPLHPSRLRLRGFNQALELARPLAQRLRVPVGATLCQRVRPTLTQSDLSALERRRNVRGAFAAQRAVAGLRVALVDDVLTTGHTVEEIARTLHLAGAAAVEVWVCARAPLS